MFRRVFLTILISLTAYLQGAEYRFDASRLRAMAADSSIPATLIFNGNSSAGQDDVISSVSLLEAFPLMENVYRMDIVTGGRTMTLQGEDLADRWAEMFLTTAGREVDLLTPDAVYRQVSDISFRGDRMESRSLEIWLAWEGVDELKAELERFAVRHGLSIRAVEVPSPDTKLVSVVRARGTVPDLVMIQSSAVDTLVRNRAIQDLDYMDFSGLLGSGLDAFRLDGRIRAAPFYCDTQVFMYNPRLVIPPPSPSWTLADMETIARRLQAAGSHPLVWNAYSTNWLIPFQMSFGRDSLLDADGGITMNDAATAAALSYVVRLSGQGLLVPMERDAMDALFIDGQVGMIMTGSYAIPYFESLGISFGVIPFPVNQTTGRPVSPLLDYKGFCITRQTREPVLARRVLQHLTGAGVQQRFCAALSKLPSRTDAPQLSGSSFRYREVLDRAARGGTVIPPQQIYSVYKNTMWKLLRFALSGQLSVEETLQQGQILMNNIEIKE